MDATGDAPRNFEGLYDHDGDSKTAPATGYVHRARIP